MIIDDLKTRIAEFLKDGDLASFREWFAPVPLDIEDCADAETIQLVYGVQREIVDLSEGFLDEYNLKQNLRARLYGLGTAVYFLMGGELNPSKVVSSTSTSLSPAETVWGSVGVGLASAL
jgi:hypothetical protein